MHIKSILTSEERFVSGDLVNHAATGSPQDESVRCASLWSVHTAPPLLCWDTTRRAVATAPSLQAGHTTMNKRLSTISYQLSAALVLTIIGYLPSAFDQAPASGQKDPSPPSVAGTTYAAASKPRMTEPLEKPATMPPAYIYRLETGPRMISQFGVFTSFQVNVDANGNNILGDAANEPSITVDPTNTTGWQSAGDSFNSVSPISRQGVGIYHRWRYDVDISRCLGR